MKHIISILFLTLLFRLSVNAQSGSLDKSFGENGILIDKNYQALNADLLLQPNMKIISIGSGGNSNEGGFLMARYNKDGTTDGSFGINGLSIVDVGVNSTAYKAALSKTGQIAVVGNISTLSDGSDLAIVLYKANGIVDSSFGNNGIIFKSLGVYDQPCGISFQSDGKLIIAGATQGIEGSPYTIFILRFNIDGTPDNSFGSNGIFEQTVAYAIDVNGFALQADGNILIGGDYLFNNNQAYFIRRYLSNGAIDTQFGKNGESLVIIPNSISNLLASIILQADNKILLCGTSINGQTFYDFSSIVRLNTNGTLDGLFGSNGIKSTYAPTAETSFAASDIAVAPDGKIVTSNNSYDGVSGSFSYYAACRYDENGKTDSSFGVNGIQVTDVSGSQTTKNVLVQNDHKIVISGHTYIQSLNGNYTALIRYNGDDEKIPIYVKIKKWLLHHGFIMQNIAGGLVSNYIVQRSNNCIEFTNITASTAITNTQPTITFQDNHPLPGLNYYRVMATNMQGLQSYSNILTISAEPFSSVKIYPNPVRNTLHIEGLPTAEKTKLSIIDFNGNTKAITTITGNTSNWNIAQLNKGNYMLKIEQTNAQFAIKFIKE